MTVATKIHGPAESGPSIETLDITVLMGGPSAEREVSLNSGRAVAAALARAGHRVSRSDISPQDLSALDKPADLIFIALHGTFGEDGQLQSILEERGMPYAGSCSASSTAAMNKATSKARFQEAGVPTPAFEVITREQVNQVVHCWKLPAVIKPTSEGSSIDVSIETDAYGFNAALERVVNRYGSALIEEYISGPELTVGVLGDTALPVCEIRTGRLFYDYTAKYLDDTTQYLFDLDLPGDLLAEIQALSLRAHRALDCRDFSRVDWMVDARTHRPYVLEVNTIPGFTDHSLLPKAAARVGITFDQLCHRIVQLASRRRR